MFRLAFVLALSFVGAQYEQTPHTYFEFTRAFDTCDVFGDRPFDGTLKAIWAYNDADPQNMEDFAQHTYKGSTPIHLKTAEYEAALEGDTKTAYVRRPLMPLKYGTRKNSLNSTYYWSAGFDLWDILGKQGVRVDENNAVHITKWEMAFNQENFRNMHHLNIIPCPKIAESLESLRPEYWGESGTYNMPGEDTVTEVLNDCWLATGTAPVMAWVLGTEPQQFPPEVGLKVGGEGGMRYVLLGLHYDIPSYDPPSVKKFGDPTPEGWQPEKILFDDTGVKFWYTQQLRPNDLGFAWIGINPDRTNFIVPPKQPEYVSYAVNNPHCWDPLFEQRGLEEVTVLQVLMHGHDQDTKFRIRHIRDGKELPNPGFDPNYNNYYQQWLTKKFTWRKGDRFIVECTINSMDFTRPLTGGLNTDEQMCIGMFMIYPTLDANSLIEWTLDETDQEPGRFRSNPGDGLDCTGETYYWPEFEPLPEEKTCLEHRDPSKLGDVSIRRIEYDDIDFSKYEQHRVLDGYEAIEDKIIRDKKAGGKYHLYWTYNEDTETVDFLADVETTGWIGFGISPNGGMKDADVLMMYIDDKTGQPFFYDRYAEGEFLPTRDFFQDGFNIKGGQHNTPIFLGTTEIETGSMASAPAAEGSSTYFGILVFLCVVASLILIFSAGAFYINFKQRRGIYHGVGTEMGQI